MLQPHDTPLSQMLAQNRRILAAVAQTIGGEPGRAVYPLHPCHCLLQPPLEECRLREGGGGCTILTPLYRNGFLFRPVEAAGLRLQNMPPGLVHALLPFLPPDELERTAIPQGFVFGYLRASALQDRTEAARIEEAIAGLGGKPVGLRVFRLRQVEYSWGHGEVPEAVRWTLGPPRWTKAQSKG